MPGLAPQSSFHVNNVTNRNADIFCAVITLELPRPPFPAASLIPRIKRCLEISTSLENGKRWRRASVSQGRHLSICCLLVKGLCLRETLRGIKDTGLTGREETDSDIFTFAVVVQGLKIGARELWNPWGLNFSETKSVLRSRLVWSPTFKVKQRPQEPQVFDKMLKCGF